MHFGFVDVILLQRGRQHVSAIQAANFMVVRTRIQI